MTGNVPSDTTMYEKLFEDCAAGNLEKTRVGLNELRYQRKQPDPIQPLAALAAQRGHSDILKLCLDEGAVFDVHLEEAALSGSRTAAMLDVLWDANWRDIQHNKRVIRGLLSRSIYQKVGVLKWLIDHGGELELGMFEQAAWANVSVPVMEIMVEKFGIQPLEYTGSLQMAASRGSRDLVEYLLGAGANVNEVPPPLDPREPGPFTALYEAVHNRHVDVVRVLLEHGADVDMPCGTFSGMSVLQIAREEGDIEILSLLLEKSKGFIPKELKV
jgi:ankyrin repeat protein